MVPLSKIVLWHPVRGRSERESASAKTNMRAEAMKEFFKRKPVKKSIQLTERLFSTIPNMGSSDAISAVLVKPMTEEKWSFYNERAYAGPKTRKHISNIYNVRKTMKRNYANRTTFYNEFVSPNIPAYKDAKDFNLFLVSSGQGRLQAIKEALPPRFNPSQVFVEMQVYDVPRNLCSLFVVTGNEYRQDGFFNNARHATNKVYIPKVETCYKDGVQKEDVLSIMQEIDLGARGKTLFNKNTFSENSYDEDEDEEEDAVENNTE
jgi:hypothetical protein